MRTGMSGGGIRFMTEKDLNVQVYNRCVGTRFCEANCPYKVRRFNFFGYADGQEYANLGAETIRAQHNPDVSTRQRGVMEKCTYCVQRISRARRAAEKEDRKISDGEVVTACQSACPTRAISFGDINDAGSRVTFPQDGTAPLRASRPSRNPTSHNLPRRRSQSRHEAQGWRYMSAVVKQTPARHPIRGSRRTTKATAP